MKNGGKRPGAGRKPGSLAKKTLEKAKIQEAFNQRVLAHADALFNAQLKLATGSQRVFRIDETLDKKGNTKREHVLVDDPDEIKALLDEHEGADGVVNDVYYYFQTVIPDHRAIEGMLNRTLGKATEHHEHSGPDNQPIQIDLMGAIGKIYGDSTSNNPD
jgi:hypothetical protein